MIKHTTWVSKVLLGAILGLVFVLVGLGSAQGASYTTLMTEQIRDAEFSTNDAGEVAIRFTARQDLTLYPFTISGTHYGCQIWLPHLIAPTPTGCTRVFTLGHYYQSPPTYYGYFNQNLYDLTDATPVSCENTTIPTFKIDHRYEMTFNGYGSVNGVSYNPPYYTQFNSISICDGCTGAGMQLGHKLLTTELNTNIDSWCSGTTIDDLFIKGLSFRLWGGNYYGVPNDLVGANIHYSSSFLSGEIVAPVDDQYLDKNFNVIANITIPSILTYDVARITFFGPVPLVGYYSVYDFYSQNLVDGYQGFYKLISGLPDNTYTMQLRACKRATGDCSYALDTKTNLVIKNLTPTLPDEDLGPSEVPPAIPTYYDYHALHSSYGTSTSDFALNMGEAIYTPLNYMAVITGGIKAKFPTASAVETGQLYGLAILTARSYITNLNSFFGDLPVGQALVLFLLFLFALGIYKIVLSVIHLFKP